MAWELINTAPQDGTHILAIGTISYNGRRGVKVQREIWQEWTETYAYVPVSDGLYRRDVVKTDIRWEPDPNFNPTHWMTLPRPPIP